MIIDFNNLDKNARNFINLKDKNIDSIKKNCIGGQFNNLKQKKKEIDDMFGDLL